MQIDAYPPQEAFTEIGARYHREVLRRGRGVTGIDIDYGESPYQRLTVVPAVEPNGDVLMLLHGGGWTNGYKEWMLFMAPALIARGVTVVSAGYRLAPQHVFPDCYRDVLDAVAVVHRTIDEYGGKADRIFLGGHSAGGHLAALAAVRKDWTAAGLPANALRGALPISGTYRFGTGSGLSVWPRFLGPEKSPAETEAAPIHHLHSGVPPFLVTYGDKDFPHLIRQARDFVQALRAFGIEVTELALPECDHLGASYETGDPEGIWVRVATHWMQER